MRDFPRVLLVVSVLVLVIATGSGSSRAATGATIARAGAEPAGPSSDWVATIQQNIAQEEYYVTWQDTTVLPDLDAAWHAPNRAHDFRTYFTADGIRVVRRTETEPTWEWSLSLVRVGRPGALRDVEPAVLSSYENRIDYERPGEFELLEWYVNDPRGIEQGFTIPRPPEERGDRLYLDIAVRGSLHAVLAEDRQSFDFQTMEGRRLIHYGHLKVTDAAGEVLRSWMEGFSVAGAGGIRLVIEDVGARYPLDVDPLATTPAWLQIGSQVEERYGFALGSAGDVNGDGYGDIVVGSPWFDEGHTDEGKVFVYHGSASGLPFTPSWTSTLNQGGALLGYSVSTAGDVNRDGFSDLVVGAPDYHEPYGPDEGEFVLYLGGPSGLDNGVVHRPNPNPDGDVWAGYSVSTAGDVNGDGYSDVIVGGPVKGKVWVYHGGPSGLTWAWLVDKSVSSSSFNSRFGRAVGLAGDVNGDGYSDVIVGWPAKSRALVWYGSSGGLGSSEDWSVTADLLGIYQYGWSVGTAGDVDGDGFSDVLVGAPFYSGNTMEEGGAFLYRGSVGGLLSNEAWLVEGNQAESQFGISVSTAGDVNGDGYSDVIVGANRYDNDLTDEGRAFVYFGSASGLHFLPDWMVGASSAGASFGYRVATGGDVNGDGYSDVLVGMPYYSSGVDERGGAALYHGSAAGLETNPSWVAESGQTDARLGTSVSTAGDVNRDGYDDVIVGVPRYDNGQVDEGRFYVYFGNENGVDNSWTSYREGGQDGALLGDAVASAGDINGDGYGDIIVGAPGRSLPEASEGRVFVYLGGPTGISIHWRGESNVEYAYFGDSVASAGDVNGDGYGDIIVGAPAMDAPTNAEGAAYVWYGSASGLGANGTPANADWAAESNQEYANMGASVASAGDVNGDGYSDVIVGCIYYSGGQSAEGATYVWHGSPTGLDPDGNPGNADWSVQWNQANAHLGRSVASAGDVNGDGYADVIVGGSGYDNGSTNSAGRVSIYHGSAAGLLTSPSFNWLCNQDTEYCGFSVAGLGDTNGDGYADVAFGGIYYDGIHGAAEGKVVVLLGSASGVSASTAVTYVGGQAGAHLGHSVASAGDVNADGYADMIVGAPYYSNGQSGEGRAFVFLGNMGVARTVMPRQRTSIGTPVARLGPLSDPPDAVNLAVTAHGFLGRGKVSLEKELKRTGEPLDGSATEISSSWINSGYQGSTFGSSTYGLEIPDLYHWRLRVRQHPTSSPYQLWGRWITRPWGGRNEGMFRFWSDADGDGIDDRADNCPDVSNPGQEDGDGDGVGDHCDNCLAVPNADQADGDADGIGDACDTCTDADGDAYGAGLPAELCPPDNCPAVYNSDQTDTDADGQGDACDDCTDTDGDGYGDPDFPASTCPTDNCPFTHNPGQENNDGDAAGDACDPDDDNDAVPDVSDNCPFTNNPGQENNDGDAAGDACDPDDDNDAVPDASDNCPFTLNPGQEDHDGDGMGDACDPDDDDDGALDGVDCLPLDAGTWSIPSDPSELRISKEPAGNLSWTACSAPGTVHTVLYDVLLSTNPAGWGYDAASCVESDDTDLVATETSEPLPGNAYYYLVRSQNDCGGNMGVGIGGAPRGGRACP